MSSRPRPKVGLVVCAGEELAEGTVTRLAAVQVLEVLRPANTVTLCLPALLAGTDEERGFARYHATIAVDGCPIRCAARATGMFSAAPAASLVVSELAREHGLPEISGCRRLNDGGKLAVALTARRIAGLVDEVLRRPRTVYNAPPATARRAARPPLALLPAEHVPPVEEAAAGTGGAVLPARTLVIAGRAVEVVALLPILEQFHSARRSLDEHLGRELLAAVRIYNTITHAEEPAWAAALLLEYAALVANAAA